MGQPRIDTTTTSLGSAAWAFWLGWAWIAWIVAAAIATAFGWGPLARALDLQSLL